MTLKLDRVISIATLVVLVVAVVLLLKKPAPVAQEPKPAAGTAANVQPVNSQTLDQKPDPMVPASMPAQQSSQAAWQAHSGAGNSASSSTMTSVAPQAQNLPASQSAKASEAHSTSSSDAIGAAINQMLGVSAGSAALSPESEVGSGAPNIKDQKVTYEGDTVHGQFLTEIGGRDVWVTISGHMGQKDGYATFDPTEFKIGDVNVPVALVNPALQRKLAEERDRLKLSDSK
jgi:hypothetical protein